MLDPISILNIIGFSFQCSQLLIGGIGRFKQQAKTARHCESRLRHYKLQLWHCSMRMTDWCQIWGFDAKSQRFNDETLTHFWGPEGFEFVQKLLQDISSLSIAIEKKLTGKSLDEDEKRPSKLQKLMPHRQQPSRSSSDDDKKNQVQAPTAGDWEHWCNLTKIHRNVRKSNFNVRDDSVIFTISFALFNDEDLQRDIAELDKKTELFVKHTEANYKRLRGISSQQSISIGDLVEYEQRRTTVDKFTTFAEKLHGMSKTLGGNWTLELRHPDMRGNAAQWKYVYDINLDFTLHNHTHDPEDPKPPGCKRVRIRYDPDMDQDVQLQAISVAISNMQNDDPPRDSSSEPIPVSSLGQCEQLSRPLRTLFWDQTFKKPQTVKAWELDQARLLFAFVNWMIMLFNTPWTDHACCCEIRFEKLRNGETQYVLSTMNQNTCQNSLIKGQKLLLLGVVLSEIILRRPLRLPAEHVNPSYWNTPGNSSLLGSSVSSGNEPSSQTLLKTLEQMGPRDPAAVKGHLSDWQAVDKQRILRDIAENTSAELTKAVEFCFENTHLAEGDNAWPQVTQDLVAKVLTPMDAYFKTIEKQRQAFAWTTWWAIFNSSWAWPPADCYDAIETCRAAVFRRVSTSDLDKVPGAFPVENAKVIAITTR